MTGAARLSRTRTCSCVPARPSRAICVVLPVWHLHRRRLPVRVVPPMHAWTQMRVRARITSAAAATRPRSSRGRCRSMILGIPSRWAPSRCRAAAAAQTAEAASARRACATNACSASCGASSRSREALRQTYSSSNTGAFVCAFLPWWIVCVRPGVAEPDCEPVEG